MKHVVDGTPRGRGDHSGWSIAAALGLLAAAFLVERFAPLEDEIHPPQAEAKRDTSAAGLAAEGDGRGRSATSPSEIPAKGWKDILWRVYGNIGEHRILALAAGMTYYSILAIFPAMAALVAIYGLFSDPGSIAKHLDDVSGFIPGGAVDVAREQLTRVATKGDRTLGFTFAIGLGISLWSANAAMKSLFDTLNIVYGEQEKRGFLKLNAMSLGFTAAGIALRRWVRSSSFPWYCSTLACRTQPTSWSGLGAGRRSLSSSRSLSPVSTASGQAAKRHAGRGSPGAARPRPSFGLGPPHYSPSTPRTSAPSTRPTAL